MQNKTTTSRTRFWGRVASIATTAALAGGLLVVGAVPAQAGGCTAGVLCGWVYNAGSTSVKVGADYNGWTITGQTTWVNSGKWSPSGIDWDAFWVPAGACGRAYRPGGRNGIDLGTLNRIGSSTGAWKKVDNQGAYVTVKYGSCP